MRILKLISPVIVATVFTVLAVNNFAGVDTQIAPLSANLSVNFDLANHGVTRIMLPPIGSIEATTHSGPLSIFAELEAVDVVALEELLNQSEPQNVLYDSLMDQSGVILQELIWKSLLLGLVGGALGYLLVGPRRFSSLLVGAFIGMLLVSASFSASYQNYDVSALENPKFTGAMEYAPWMISFVERSLTGVAQWGQKLGQMAESVQSLGAKAQAASFLEEPPSALVVLHVSDIHNNPAGYEMIKGIVNQFNVDLIIDTGDTSDFGTKIESELSQAIASLGVDYLWVPGNHDSPEIIKAMAKLNNLQVVDGLIEDKGLTVAGLPDPASASNDVHSTSEEIEEYAEKIRALVRNEEPEVLAVHNYRVAQELVSLAPVILTGHNHQASWEEIQGSVLVNPGSTGAEGLRGLQKAEGSPYTAVLLYFAEDEESYNLKYLDYLEFSSDGTGFSLDRYGVKGNEGSLKNSTDDDRTQT